MIRKKECVAMLLAGGQGSRLHALTDRLAKPAVTFGAKYRIIDFPLSNCVNSGIDTVGVLTQYQPLILNEYIGNGKPWDLDRNFGGVHILPPYQGKNKIDWYRGTANAIYQNIHFLKRYDPEYVLVLSGDHIYKMDYGKMLHFHKQNDAALTIAVINVPLSEASRFGIMNTDEVGRVISFEEKPKNPKSTRASMGIYIFDAAVLYRHLEEDEANLFSAHDFGKNIIPRMVEEGEAVYAYEFNGYWKDVGTVASLWEANADLLGENPAFNLYDPDWRIYSRNFALPPQFIADGAKIENSIITEGCYIEGTVIDSLLSNNVRVEKGAVVKDTIIFANTAVEAGATVNYAIIDENVTIKKNAVVGAERGENAPITLVAHNVTIGEDMTVPAGEIIEKDLVL